MSAKSKWGILKAASKILTLGKQTEVEVKDIGQKEEESAVQDTGQKRPFSPLAWWQSRRTKQGSRLRDRLNTNENGVRIEVQPRLEEEVVPEDVALKAFHGAAASGNTDALRQWLPRLRDVDVRNKLGETACHIAARCSQVRAVCELLELGADPLAVDGNCDLDIEDNWMSDTRLGKQSSNGGKSVIYYLRLTGILKPVFENLFPVTRSKLAQSLCSEMEALKRQPALVFAARTGQLELAELLLKHSSYTLAGQRGVTTQMFRSVAGSSGTIGVVESPTVRGAALFAACCVGKTDIVKLLLRRRLPLLELRCFDSFGRTPLHVAAIQGHVEIVNILLQQHAPHDIYSAQGCTPLLDATVFGHTGVVDALLKADADPCVSVRSGAAENGGRERNQLVNMTAAEIAAKRMNKRCHTLLLEAVEQVRKKKAWEAKLKKTPLFLHDNVNRFEAF